VPHVAPPATTSAKPCPFPELPWHSPPPFPSPSTPSSFLPFPKKRLHFFFSALPPGLVSRGPDPHRYFLILPQPCFFFPPRTFPPFLRGRGLFSSSPRFSQSFFSSETLRLPHLFSPLLLLSYRAPRGALFPQLPSKTFFFCGC